MGRSAWRRTAVTGAVVALALALTGCLQDPNDSGGGAGGHQWQRRQQPGRRRRRRHDPRRLRRRRAGELRDVARAVRGGVRASTSSTPRTPTSPPRSRPSGSRRHAGHRLLPAARAACSSSPPTATIQPIDTYLDYDTLDGTLVPGFLDVGPAERPRLRRPDADGRSRASSGTRRRPGTQAGYRGARRRCEELTDLADQIKADGHHPVVHGAGTSDQATGWVGTDWIEEFVLTLARPGRLRPVDQPRDPVRRPADRRGVRRVRQDRQDRRPGARRRRGHPEHAGRRVDGPGLPTTRPSACCERQGNFDIVVPARRRSRPTSTTRSASSRSRRSSGGYDGAADPRWRRPRRAVQRQRRRGDRGHGVPDLRPVRRRVGAGRRLALAAHAPSTRSNYPERDDQGHRRAGDRRLRRLRSTAPT